MKFVTNILELCKIPPVVFDGFLCCTLAMCVELENVLGKDDAYKYMNAYWLFYVKLVAALYSAGASALIFFRSKSYTDHIKNKTLPPNTANNNNTVVENK